MAGTAIANEPVRKKTRLTRPFWLAGLLAGFLGATGGIAAMVLTAAAEPARLGQDGNVRLIPIKMSDLDSALQTISADQRDQIRAEVAACKTALFMMDIGPMPRAMDSASGFVQLRVGSYLSPRFAVGKTVTSLAVPHPIPDAKTLIHGTIDVVGSARSLRVSFTPPVDYAVLSGSVAQPVYFELPQACGTDQGTPAG